MTIPSSVLRDQNHTKAWENFYKKPDSYPTALLSQKDGMLDYDKERGRLDC